MDYLDENNRLIAAPEPRWMTSPKRLRVYFGGTPIVDTTRANLFRGGGPPVYYFPKDDVQQGALTATGRTETNARGTMSLYDVQAGERAAEGAAWEYTEPADDVPFLAGMLAFRWNAMDAWYEEEEEVFVHAKDPFKRIETFRSNRHVEVYAGGEKVADSGSPVVLIEPGHPLRYYLPKTDVRMDLLRPTETESRCPYKGKANYYAVETDNGLLEDAAWCYKYPTTETAGVAGLVCFFNERVDAIRVDGEELEKPVTNWRR